MASLFKVKIDFQQSQLYFPRIIIGVLIVLLIIIAIMYLPGKIREMRDGKKFRFFEENFDKLKLFGSIVLIAVYFEGMDLVGRLFPNMGYGFLFTSVVFMFIISLLFVGRATKKKMLAVTLNSVLTPVIIWFLFDYLFNILLP